MIQPSHTVVHFFNDGYRYVGEQEVAWKEYCAEYWLKELQERMDRCIGLCNITEIMLKMVLCTTQTCKLVSSCQRRSWPLIGARLHRLSLTDRKGISPFGSLQR